MKEPVVLLLENNPYNQDKNKKQSNRSDRNVFDDSPPCLFAGPHAGKDKDYGKSYLKKKKTPVSAGVPNICPVLFLLTKHIAKVHTESISSKVGVFNDIKDWSPVGTE